MTVRDHKAEYARRDKKKARATGRDWHRRNPSKQLDYDVRSKYGITGEDYERMLSEQGGVCAVCKETETVTRRGKIKRLGVDHCHDTGCVRGLVCENCNRALGLLRDDPTLARAAAEYLERKAGMPFYGTEDGEEE